MFYVIISKDGWSSEGVKSKIDKAHGIFSQLKQIWKNRNVSLQTKIRMLAATVIPWFVKYGKYDTLSNVVIKHSHAEK